MSGLTAPQRAALVAITLLSALAGVAHYDHWGAVTSFAIATLALAGLAWVVSFATERLGERFGTAVTGVLQATLGNLPELFVVIFALQKGEITVARTAIVGSILANALLVLGFVIVVGSARAPDKVMRFSKELPRDTATLLQVTVFIIVLLGLSVGTEDPASNHVKTISIVGAICLLGVYLTWVVPYLRSDRPPRHPAEETAAAGAAGAPPRGGEPSAATPGPAIGLATTLVLLGISAVAAAFVSDWFVAALHPAISTLSLSSAFAGLVIVAIAGNAVEHAVGVVLAFKGQSDLAMSVVKNSVAQIAAFFYPALVLISLGLNHTLTFELAPVYIGALALTVLALAQVTGDGRARAFEGWALVAFYIVLATVALYE